MKAMVYQQYGPPDVLTLTEVEKPTPKEHEVLIKVHATSVNSWDWDLLRGEFLNRLVFGGFRKPKRQIIGCDIAGQVEAVGKQVKELQPGDAVFGDLSGSGWGGFAEYVCARETALTRKPASMSFTQAAAIPQAGLLALQGLRNQRAIQPGEKVLINGAGGGMGTFGIQLAKSFGAEVTGVDSTPKLALMRTIGADHLIDYTEEDFTHTGQKYDLILDAMAHRSIFAYKRALSPTGTFVMVGGSKSTILQTATLGMLLSKRGGQQLGILAHRPNQGMAALIELFEAGTVTPVIDRCYPLAQTADALRYLGEGHARGKIVVTMEQ